jgi:hypothetical protein
MSSTESSIRFTRGDLANAHVGVLAWPGVRGRKHKDEDVDSPD